MRNRQEATIFPPSLPAPSASLSWFPITNMSIVYSSVRTSGTLRGPDLPAHLWEDPGSHIRLHMMLTQKPRVHPVYVPQDRESQLLRQNGKGSCWDFWNSEPLGHLIREDERVLEAVHDEERETQGHHESAASKGPYCRARWPELHHRDPHGGRKPLIMWAALRTIMMCAAPLPRNKCNVLNIKKKIKGTFCQLTLSKGL